MTKEVRGKDYLDRLKELNVWTLEDRRNRTDLVELFKMYKGFTAKIRLTRMGYFMD